MNEPLPTSEPLSQTQFLREITQTFRDAPYSRWGSSGFYMAAAVVLLVVALVVGSAIRQRMRRSRALPRHKWLFARAMRKLKLSFSDRWLLKRMAKSYGGKAPTAILLSPTLLAKAARSYQRACSHPALREAIGQRAETLSHLLFGRNLPRLEG